MKRRIRTNEYNNELYEMPIMPRDELETCIGQASCSQSPQQLPVINSNKYVLGFYILLILIENKFTLKLTPTLTK